MHLRQSTTGEIIIGPFLDFSDGITPLTSLTLDHSDVQLSKSAGNLVEKSETTTLTHYSGGWYHCLLDATDTNTVGRLVIQSQNPTSYVPVWHEFEVVEENIFDALYAPSANGFDSNQQVSVYAVNSGAIPSGGLTTVAQQELADTIIGRSVQHVENSASKYSLARVILAATSWAQIGGTGIQIRKTDGSEFDIIALSGDSSANLVVTIG